MFGFYTFLDKLNTMNENLKYFNLQPENMLFAAQTA